MLTCCKPRRVLTVSSLPRHDSRFEGEVSRLTAPKKQLVWER